MKKIQDIAHDLWILVGGKRGLSCIASGVITYLAATGRITPAQIGLVGTISGALGLAGIAHNNIRVAGTPDSTGPLGGTPKA